MSEEADTDYITDLAKTLYRNSLQKKNTDFTIVVANTKISCHSSVVCARSEYFDSLYSSGIRQAKLDECGLSKNGEIVRIVVRYIYTGTIKLAEDTVLAILQAAVFIKCDMLTEHCVAYMNDTLGPENYRSYSEFASKYALRGLHDSLQSFRRRMFSSLLPTAWFIPSLSFDDLLACFKDEALTKQSEDDVLEALGKWLSAQSAQRESEEKRAAYLEQLMPFVKLAMCDPKKRAAMQQDPKVPALLKVKLYEFERQGRKEGAPCDPRIVVVGGRKQENVPLDEISYLNEHQENINVTNAEACTSCTQYSVCFSGDWIAISGGYSHVKRESVSAITQYNTWIHRWVKLPDMRQGRSRHVTVIIGHLLYVIAGCFELPDKFKQRYKETEVLDLSTGKWATAAKIPHSVTNAGVAVVNGQIVLTGGLDSAHKFTAKTIKYNPSKNKWVNCASMPKSRASVRYSTLAFGDHLFALAHTDFFMYNITSNEWSILAAPPKPSLHSAMALHNDALVVLGGHEEGSQEPHGLVQHYNLRTQKWSVDEKKMTTPVSSHFACLMKLKM